MSLRKMWQSVVGVADFLQTDDLFQMATPRPLPELPDFDELSHWACGHDRFAASCRVKASGAPAATAATQGGELIPPPHEGESPRPPAPADAPRNDEMGAQSRIGPRRKAGPVARRPEPKAAGGGRLPALQSGSAGPRRIENR